MTYHLDDLIEAKRQIDSTIHKLIETKKTLESKDNVHRYKSQITLAEKRIQAFSLASALVNEKITTIIKSDSIL